MSDTGAADGTGGDPDGRGDRPLYDQDEADWPVVPDNPLADLAGEDEFYELPLEGPDDGEPHTALPGKVEAWRRRSATGAILTGFALGLQEVFDPKRDEPAVIMETSGDPPKDLPVEADFEYGRPKQSVVNVRPWLLPAAANTESEDDAQSAADDPSGEHGRSDTPHDGERDA